MKQIKYMTVLFIFTVLIMFFFMLMCEEINLLSEGNGSFLRLTGWILFMFTSAYIPNIIYKDFKNE